MMQERPAYGMQLPVQSQSTLYAEAWEADAGPGDLVAAARAADRHGFAYLACCEHVAIPRRLAGAMSTVWYDPAAALPHLGAVTDLVLFDPDRIDAGPDRPVRDLPGDSPRLGKLRWRCRVVRARR